MSKMRVLKYKLKILGYYRVSWVVPEDPGDMGSITGSGRSPGEGNGSPFWEIPRTEKPGELQVHGVARRQTWLSDCTTTKGYYDSKTSDKAAVLWDSVCTMAQSQKGRKWQGVTLLPEQQKCDVFFAWGLGKARPSIILRNLMITSEPEKHTPWPLSYWARCASSSLASHTCSYNTRFLSNHGTSLFIASLSTLGPLEISNIIWILLEIPSHFDK